MTTPFGGLHSTLDVNPWTRYRDLLGALGVLSWPLGIPTSGAIPTSQAVLGLAHYLYRDEVVSNLSVPVQTAGAGTAPTAIKLGVWSSAATPACLAVTAELRADASWNSTGWKMFALASRLTIPSDGLYYGAFLQNGSFGTTNIQLAQAGVVAVVGNPIGSGRRLYGSLKTGATDMAVTDTGTYAQAGSVPLIIPS
jgi:hypothetical protein